VQESGTNTTSLYKISLDKTNNTEHLLTSNPSVDGKYRAVHYDPHSNSIFLAFTKSDNSTIFQTVRLFGNSPEFGSMHSSYLPQTLPYDMTTDAQFVYWTDWSRGGVMRLKKDGSEFSATMIANAASYVHKNKYEYPGAMEIVALEDPLSLCHKIKAKQSDYNLSGVKYFQNEQAVELSNDGMSKEYIENIIGTGKVKKVEDESIVSVEKKSSHSANNMSGEESELSPAPQGNTTTQEYISREANRVLIW